MVSARERVITRWPRSFHDGRAGAHKAPARAGNVGTGTANAIAMQSRATWKDRTTNRHVHTPGHAQCFVKAGLLACRHPSPLMPSRAQGTVAFDRGRQAYSSGGCAGLARDGYRARHRLPVSPSGRRAGGHHSLDGGDSKSGATGCHRLIVLLTRKNGEALARPRRFRRGACRASCPARIRQAYLPARRRRAAPMPSRPAPSRTSDTGSGTSAAASASSTLSDELAK